MPERILGAVCPHAGWRYSGTLATQAIRALARANPDPELAIVLGGHLGPRDLPRIFLEGRFGTPLGPLAIAERVAEDASMAIESELETPDDYFDDVAIEVLAPIIKHHWPSVELLAVGIPPTDDAPSLGVELVHLAQRRRYERMVVIASTDLTHYGPDHRYVPKGRGRDGLAWMKTENDPAMIAAIEAFDAGRVLWMGPRARNACSPGAVAAAIAAAGKLGARRGTSVGYTTSFDAEREYGSDTREPHSFVGYAAAVLGP